MNGYLPHIDGLRGFAIFLVVGFHYFGVRGGFVGVDVFFVISGFLITQILIGDMLRGTFSFSMFFAKRVRRIFPSLIAVLIGCFAIAWLLFFGDDFLKLGRHISSGSLFLSNFQLWGEAGYFDEAAELKPLLHLWSLAVEEQFYLVWPAVLFLAYRSGRGFAATIWFFIAASFVLNLYTAQVDSAQNFYLLPSRLWELALGGWIGYRHLRVSNISTRPRVLGRFSIYDLAQWVGLLLVVFAALALSQQQPFPNWRALIPVVGTCLIIAGGETGWVSRRILSRPWVIQLGKISFSLYLWHWPLLVFLKLSVFERPSDLERTLVLLLSLVLSILTYRFIETPLRYVPVQSVLDRRRVIAYGIAAILLIAGLGHLVQSGFVPPRLDGFQPVSYEYFVDGYTHKPTNEMYAVNGLIPNQIFAPEKPLVQEKINYPNRPLVFLVGDSYAAGLSLAMKELAQERKFNFIYYGSLNCTPLDTEENRTQCSSFHKYFYRRVRELTPDLVIVDAKYAGWDSSEDYNKAEHFENFITRKTRQILEYGAKHVLIVGQIPQWTRSLPWVLNRHYVRFRKIIPERMTTGLKPESMAMDEKLSAAATRAQLPYFSLTSVLCDFSGCQVKLGQKLPEDLIVFDEGHLTVNGARFLVNKMKPHIQSVLADRY